MKPAPGCIHEDGGRRVILAFHDREQEECARCVLDERDRLLAERSRAPEPMPAPPVFK